MANADFLRALRPEDGALSQIEGYEFDVHVGPDHVVVAWTTDDAFHTLVVQTGKATVMDKFGGVNTILDGDDGTVDGRVHMSIGPSPVYVTFEP